MAQTRREMRLYATAYSHCRFRRQKQRHRTLAQNHETALGWGKGPPDQGCSARGRTSRMNITSVSASTPAATK